MSMHYFSVLTPAPGREREAAHQRLAADAYADHQWLWRLFPAPPGTPRDFLFRRQEQAGLPRYYLVSQRAPASPGSAWQLQTRAYAPQLAAGDRLAFELRACPTVRRTQSAIPGGDQAGIEPHPSGNPRGHPRGHSQRHDVVMDAKRQLLAERGLRQWADWVGDEKPPLYELVQQACVAWLAQRGERGGFELDTAQCIASGYQQFGHRASARHPEAGPQFSSVELSGELTVHSPAAFQDLLLGGIGSAKAFGCGLLLVRRLA